MSVVSLGELVSVQTGKLDANASSPDGAYPFFTCAREPLRIADWKYDLEAILVAGNGDLNIKHYKGRFDAYQRTYILSSKDENRVDTRYLYHFLDTYLETLRAQSIGGIIKYIKLGMLTDAPIPLPPLDEQKRIAAILDQADELRRKRQRSIDRLNQLGQAVFHEMFGADEAEMYSIAELIEDGSIELHKDGNHGSNYPRKEEFSEEGIPFLSANAVDDTGQLISSQIQKLSERKAKTLTIGWIRDGDVLLSHNASVGKVALYEGQYGDALIGTSLTCYRVNRVKFTPHFMFYALRSLDFQCQLAANMAQTTRNQVPITAQRRLALPKPSLAEQIAFEEKMKFIAAQTVFVSDAREKSDVLFASLQDRAFRGEL